MGKKTKKRKIVSFDWEIGLHEIIPSTRKKEETETIKDFREKFLDDLSGRPKHDHLLFPIQHHVFVYIQQYFKAQKEYDSRDVDNFSKTILDVLKGPIFKDDTQVKTLLVSKKIDERIFQNFAYIAVKILKNNDDIEALKVSNIDRSVDLFNEIKRQSS